MRNLLVIFHLFTGFSIFGQIGTGQWRMHIAASQAIDVATGNGLTMAALYTGVLEYDPEAGETKIYNDLNGLSDITVSTIAYEPGTKSFFIGYANGNIDQLYSDGSVVNIPAIKLASLTGSKRVNQFTVFNNLVYVATGFAIVVIDPVKHEVKDTYYPSSTAKNFQQVVFLNDSIYALHNDGMFKAAQNNPLLANSGNWQVESRLPIPPLDFIFQNAVVANNDLYVLYKKDGYGGDSILKLTTTGTTEVVGHAFDSEINKLQSINDKLAVSFSDACFLFNTVDLSVAYQLNFYGNSDRQIQSCAYGDGFFWLADLKYGLIKHSPTDFWGIIISREGPPKNEFFSVNGNKGKILVTGGTIDRIALSFNRAGAYFWQDEDWKLYDQSTLAPWTGDVWALGSCAVNPKADDEVAIGGYCPDAVTVITDGVPQVYNASNSVLENTTFGNNMTCIPSMEYDDDGNLWVVNAYAINPLKVRTSSGTWYSMAANAAMAGVFASELAIDYNGNKWMGVYGKGLLGYNDNGTISNTADDVYKIIGTGEGAGNLPSTNITAVACDFDNEIWIGTDAGLAVLYNSQGLFNNAGIPDVSRILVEYEGNVEILLGNSYIADIEIDGGNRKWIGTGESGIFLISADGQTVIANYTTENSPMISNVVLDMEFNQITGELFIITDNGMVSFRTDASYEDPEYSTTTVFPNPVKPDYFGPVTIQGIRYDSDVHITDAAGNLVYKTVSNGGTATWNVKRSTGEDVSSGVYFIWTATNQGKNRKVGKVVVIR